MIIAAEDTGNAARFRKERHDLSSRPLTDAEVYWEPKPWKKPGESSANQRTPDLAPLLREVLARPDWKPGNAIALMITGTGKRTASAFGGGDSKAARLMVDADPGSVAQAVETTPNTSYRLRLLFGLPPQGETRVFDVVVQGKTIRRDLRLSHDPGGTQHVIETIDRVMVRDELQIRLVPKQGEPLLSGFDLIRQDEFSGQ